MSEVTLYRQVFVNMWLFGRSSDASQGSGWRNMVHHEHAVGL